MESYLTDPRHDETQSPEERDASEPKFEAGRDTVEGTPLNPALVSETPSAEGLLYSPVTSEEFFAEGTSPLADTTPARIQIGTIESEDGEVTVPVHADEPLTDEQKQAAEEFKARKYTPIYDTGIKNRLYLERKPAVIDGDRTQLTETQMGAVVEEVLDQTLTFAENVDFFSPAMQIGALQERVYALEAFNAKLLLALKQHGFDTVKLFR